MMKLCLLCPCNYILNPPRGCGSSPLGIFPCLRKTLIIRNQQYIFLKHHESLSLQIMVQTVQNHLGICTRSLLHTPSVADMWGSKVVMLQDFLKPKICPLSLGRFQAVLSPICSSRAVSTFGYTPKWEPPAL